MSGRSTMSPVATVWTPPAEFEEFRLVRYLGGGGMGNVWLAHDLLLDRPVAVKFLAGAEPDAAATERVLVEARAAARLTHPNVAAVYRVGQLEGRPYIISEYVRGESLDSLPTPLPTERVIDLAIGLCRGLAAAHRRGVLHRDLKPHNAIVAEGGDIKLVDFGLARLVDALHAEVATPRATSMTKQVRAPARAALTGLEEQGATLPAVDERRGGGDKVIAIDRRTRSLSGTIAGTPYYMAPEAWRAETPTPRTDLYALGALMFELCAGRTPFADTPMVELPEAVASRPAVALTTVAPSVDARLAALIDRCLEREPAARFASADELLEGLLALAGNGVPASAVRPDGNPYRGLMPFEAEHRALFFGRGRDIRAVVERLRADRLVVVTGDSGAGKSSLCRAGVLPLIADGTLREGRRWSTATLLPGRHPLRALAQALATCDGDEDELERLAAGEPDALARRLQKLLGRDKGLLVFVDQLEELATLSVPDEAAGFGATVRALVEGGAAVRFVGAVRGDFLTRVAGAAQLGELLSRALYILSPLDEGATREAVVGPARLTGVAFESEELVQTLVRASVGAQGGLPLLQFALAELWEARGRLSHSRAQITRAALDGIGGVAGALARHGDRVLQALLPQERQAARRVLMRLVTLEGTRARKSGVELTDGDAAATTALEALVRGRLVVARQTDDVAVYEVAHEALVSGWTTLRGWLAAEADSGAARLRLEAAVAEWERLARAPEALWGARQLVEAKALELQQLSPRQRAFVDRSARAVRRRRWRRGALVVGLPLLVAGAFGGVRLSARQRLAVEVTQHLAIDDAEEARARSAAAEAEARAAEAFRAFDDGKSEAGEAAWKVARAAAARADQGFSRAAESLEAALALDGSRTDVRSRFADVLVARALNAESEGRVAEVDELGARLALYDADGARARRFHAPGKLALTTTPPATVSLTAWVRDRDGHRRAAAPAAIGTTPLTVELSPGSYVLTLAAPGRAPIAWPFVMMRGETLAPSLTLPASLPEGFVYVAPGRFLFGTRHDEMRNFDASTPLHLRTTDAFLIARHETTFGEWLDFLSSLPPDARARRTPRGAGNLHGAVHLETLADGSWQLALKPSEQSYAARLGSPIVYKGRTTRAAQDWRKFPVVGIDWDDVEAYAAWLRTSGRVPGARPCREDEWERAARGADDREFPHGDTLAPDDANFDETYGKQPLAFGPDAVGSHPASRSPFGLDDTSGNVWEWTRALGASGDARVLKGGAYYYGAITNRIPNRQVVERTMRDATLGVRICADAAP